MRRFTHALVLVAALTTAAVFATGALAGSGNSSNAKLCQKNGWQTVQTSTGVNFASEEECVSYGAQGTTVFSPSLVAAPNEVVEEQGIDLTGSGFHPSTPVAVSIVVFGGGSITMPGLTNATGGLFFTSVFTTGACANGITGAQYTVTDSFGVHASATVALDCP
jgi:hypothetical protein